MFAYLMKYLSVLKRVGGQLAAIVSVVAVIALMAAAAAAAAGTTETFSNSVTFIGDSVTAGFGYCGTENAKNVTCKTNEEFADSWYFGNNSLSDCAPPNPPTALNDACSNNNVNGFPWQAAPWKAGPNAPRIAYPFQLAAAQSSVNPASVMDWAMTGSTPANWDPQGGVYGPLLAHLNGQYVGMTLGANPLLSYFTDIKVAGYPVAEGKCVKSTGYDTGWFFSKWYAGPISNPLKCLTEQWAQLNQTEHLVRIYETLLGQGDRVVVLGYYRGCAWSFGNWQPNGNVLRGPSAGNNCKDERRPTSPAEPREISQWEQAVAVGNELNKLLGEAVEKARASARTRWPGTNRANNIVFTKPDPGLWEGHQPKSATGSWVFLNDTWIHPSQAGATNLAQTVAAATCSAYQHWCGAFPGIAW
jgi:hypothetical protein